jgi:hypothetical protein
MAQGLDGWSGVEGAMTLDQVMKALQMAVKAGREQLARELLAHLATISGEGQGTRDDVAHWLRCQLGEVQRRDRYADTDVSGHATHDAAHQHPEVP